VDFPKVLRPGKAGVIKVKVETGNVAGPKTKSITIKSNDPEQPNHLVNIKLVVKG
jgi:hypothetical protein